MLCFLWIFRISHEFSLTCVGIQYDKVLLCVTDAAANMVLAMTHLKRSLFPKMLHVTCLAHGLGRVADLIRMENWNVDRLISEVNFFFRKV